MRRTSLLSDSEHHLYGNGGETVYGYDNAGRLLRTTDPAGGETVRTYDVAITTWGANNRKATTEKNGSMRPDT